MVNEIYLGQEEMRQESFRQLHISYMKLQDTIKGIKCPFHSMANNERDERFEHAETNAEIQRLEDAEVCEFCIVDYESECRKHGEIRSGIEDKLSDLVGFVRGLIKWKTWECECNSTVNELMTSCIYCGRERPEDIEWNKP